MRYRNIRSDRGGGIEGLPLQLMIIILVATMGTAIILGWMGSIDTPTSIGDVSVESRNIADGSLSVEILVTDQNGNPLEDADVILTGMGVTADDGSTAYLQTDSDGKARFSGLKVMHGNNPFGFITVNVSKSGYGEDNSARVLVVN